MDTTHPSFYERLLNWLRPESKTETIILGPSQAQPLRFRLPEKIGRRYRPVRTLGKGAFGIVYLAKDEWIGRLVAIKLLSSKYRSNESIHQRFLQEARIAGQLEHPNIVSIYDVDDDGEAACIIMEYLAGGSLARLLQVEGKLDVETSLIYLRQMLVGLGAAHQMGVVHRDIKPRNILFDQNGTAKVSDFGVAHLPIEAGGIDQAGDLTTFGTPTYMAPEQMQPGHPIDSRADLYATGLVLYEMLNGRRRHTFPGQAAFQEMYNELEINGKLRRDEFPEDFAADVFVLNQRLLAFRPSDRFANAQLAIDNVDELLRDLRASQGRPEIDPEAAGTSSFHRDMYEDILRLFLVDGVVSPAERHQLLKRSQRLGMSPQEAYEAEERVRLELKLPLQRQLEEFEVLVETVLKDRDFTDEDQRILREMAARFNIAPAEQRKIQETVQARLHHPK